jgi:hypothetical protein
MFFVIIVLCYEKQKKQHIPSSITAPPQRDATGLPSTSRQAGIIISLLRGFFTAASIHRLSHTSFLSNSIMLHKLC